ncbi:mammalian cell entry protein [Mycobacterium koreense]|uniref:Mammalian cell entry protein n=1 Tax=Mycolicibacillus koreensis TaxID=1069220 RepID=A0A7I7SKB0_9MYCO|nr:mammalian cell entry protein [Mycolicibacillus koreensis]MCV7250509.1 mammalian cell entry protein [Mycolicibacillus koreensis]ODR04806.1 mammalian cell entry protein [Mycolicibacillus koreensis]OSC32756.1 mammalian cell entry protein [Mycolicibacillus koreensis]BBY56376.1 mammalian cell entry protein [Mycolicibacillus koreensis]
MTVWARRASVALIGVLACAVVALGAVGGGLYWDRVQSRAEQSARAELPALAAETIPRIFGFDYQTVETTMTDVYPMLTPRYRPDFEQQVTTVVIPQARERKLVSQISVIGQGMVDAGRTSASVLVFLNRTVTDPSGEPFVEPARVRVDYRKIDGKWLVDMIKPV